MNYLELRHEVDQLQKQIEEQSKGKDRLRAVVITDMPLQPWFDLYLQKAWAEKGRIAGLRRVNWELRHEMQCDSEEILIYWPSREAGAETDSKKEKPGIWISTETASEPIHMFYTAMVKKKDEPDFPAGTSVIDLEQLMLRVGLSQSLAHKEGRWGDVYSEALQNQVAYEIVRLYETEQGRRKKCLVLDCDGVLWGGIISEDGLDGIQLSETGVGRLHQDFQMLAKQLNQHGIILAICSKNDEADVKHVFCGHTAMKLQEGDIAAWSVSWKPKSQQMAELAEQLQIDLQDMVLVDDNQWELEEVRHNYPQVMTVLFEAVGGLRGVAEQLAKYFYLKPEDQNSQNRLRLQTYTDNVKREKLRSSTDSYEEFLEKLQTKVEIQPATESDLSRISDLSRRANQCTNGTRYTIDELKKLLQKGYQLQAVFVSDIYRDLGLVGCIGIDPKNSSFDLFCLSCRALGRRVEQQLLAALPPEIDKMRWQETGKNERLKELILSEGRWQFES